LPLYLNLEILMARDAEARMQSGAGGYPCYSVHANLASSILMLTNRTVSGESASVTEKQDVAHLALAVGLGVGVPLVVLVCYVLFRLREEKEDQLPDLRIY